MAAEEVSAAVWLDIWPQWRKEQREFFCFGMDVLLRVRALCWLFSAMHESFAYGAKEDGLHLAIWNAREPQILRSVLVACARYGV